MNNNEPFVFGGISTDTEPTGKKPRQKIKKKIPKENIKIIEKEMENFIDGYYCKDRVEHKLYLCDNKACNCIYKKSFIEYVKLQINQKIIKEFYIKNKIKTNKYTNNLLKTEWVHTHGNFGYMIETFIRNTKFVYNLDLIIEDIKKDKTATETFYCKDRVPDTYFFCKGRKYTENGEEKKCRCYHSCYTLDQLEHEVMKEIIIKNQDNLKLNTWDRIALTYNWNKLTDNQIGVYNSLLLKYQLYIQKTSTQQPTKKVIRKKITP